MLIFIIIVMVLIGLAYADYCLIDNTAHFGICYGKLAEAEESRANGSIREADAVAPADTAGDAADRPLPGAAGLASEPGIEAAHRPLRLPAPAWLLQDLEPVLELQQTR